MREASSLKRTARSRSSPRGVRRLLLASLATLLLVRSHHEVRASLEPTPIDPEAAAPNGKRAGLEADPPALSRPDEPSGRWDEAVICAAIAALVALAASVWWSVRLRRVVRQQTEDLVRRNDLLKQEVAERARVDEALRESEDRFRQLADAAPVMIWMTNADGACIGVSRAWCTFTGRGTEKELGSGWLEGVHPEDHVAFMDCYSTAQEARSGFRIEYRHRQHDGTFRWLLNVGVPRLNRAGEVLGFIGSCTDLTDRHQAELALRDRTLDLERSNSDLERFAYVASHDLQEPLRMVTSFTQLLAKKYKGTLDASADEFIGYAVEGATRMQRLIEDLLEYSRVSAQRPATIDVQASRSLETALKNIQVVVKQRGAIITSDPLPVVRANPGQLVLVFQNLLSNAIKFTHPLQPRVHVGVERADQHWVFSVTDQGIGIEPKHFDRLFVMFQRLNSREDFPGNGIGLAVCKVIIEQQRGRIWVESTPGVGTTVRFSLPAAAEGGTSP